MPGQTITLRAFSVSAATNQPERRSHALHARIAARERLDDDTEDDLASIAPKAAAIPH